MGMEFRITIKVKHFCPSWSEVKQLTTLRSAKW